MILCRSEVHVEPQQREEAQRLIRDAIRREWLPRVRTMVRHIANSRDKQWQDACDAAELTLVTSSEEIKIQAERKAGDTEVRIGWELATQAMLDIIVELREAGC